jgi:spore coat protein U-like protein
MKKTINHKMVVAATVLAISYLGLSPVSYSYAAGTSANTQATASISSVCTISAQNLSFGNLVLPLSAQSASTSMSVLCSNKSSYTIGLTYGGIYGSGISGNYWTAVSQACNSSTNASSMYYNPLNPNGTAGGYVWTEYNTSGKVVGGACTTSPPGNSGTYVATLGYTASTTNGQYYNPANTTVYNYGKMTGVANGDNIAYSIQVPNNPNQVWNNSNYSYSATGTGVTQSIPVVGKLVPAQSGSSYPTPDMYMDTVTATVNF